MSDSVETSSPHRTGHPTPPPRPALPPPHSLPAMAAAGPCSLPVGQHQKDSRRGLTDFSCSAPSSPGEGWALTGQRSGMKALPAWRARACGLLGLGRRYGGVWGCGGGHVICRVTSCSQHRFPQSDPVEGLLYFVLCSSGRFVRDT